jgi:transposase-like protein
MDMASTNSVNEVLKQDSRGRVRVPKERREALLAEFERSGLSGAAFARMAGINYQTFANWRHQRREAIKETGEMAPGASVVERTEGAGQPVRLFEAFVEHGRRPSALDAGLAIELAAGARLVVETPAQLRLAAELLGLLAQTERRRC